MLIKFPVDCGNSSLWQSLNLKEGLWVLLKLSIKILLKFGNKTVTVRERKLNTNCVISNSRILSSSRTLLASGELLRLVNHDEINSLGLDSGNYG